MIEKTAACNIDAYNSRRWFDDRTCMNSSDCGFALLWTMRERTKIMRANHQCSSGTHSCDVQRMPTLSSCATLEWIGASFKPTWPSFASVAQSIGITFASAISNWIERIFGIPRPSNFQILRKSRVESHHHSINRNSRVSDRKCRDLTTRVNSRICSARTIDGHSLAHQIRDSIGENSLRSSQRRQIGRLLPLPTMEVCSVVCDE